jgi:tetratricopeptide (TPR) repeat protein
MSDETDISNAARDTGPPNDPAAVGLALNASSAEAREYLRKQSELADKQSKLADLQIDTLEMKDEFELSHLRFRRFSDYARFALEIAVGLVVLLIVLGLGTMVWNASRDDDLVVDAFSVPSDIAQTGMTGTALANRVLDRFGAIDRNARSFTEDFTGYHRDVTEDVRVEIPDTGVSIGELNHYLRGWLGSETHVTGELVHTAKGLALTVRYGSNPGSTIEGADLGTLIQKAAENVMRTANPLRFADYLSTHDRVPEGGVIAQAETQTGDDKHRAQAYISLGYNDFWRGDEGGLAAAGIAATRIDPNNALSWLMVTAYANNMDHSESNFQGTKKLLNLVQAGKASSSLGEIQRSMVPNLTGVLQSLQGDFEGTIATCKNVVGRKMLACDAINLSSFYAAIHEIDEARLLGSGQRATQPDGQPNPESLYVEVQNAVFTGDGYAHAVEIAAKAEAMSKDPVNAQDRDIFLRPFEAEALARTGHLAEARTVVDTTPLDCDQCVRARGRVAMLAHDWKDAAHWFAIVSARSPDIPFADSDWGMMLMTKGDLDGAIAKFAAANQKGPHFADPLEMWGDVLIRKNRSDLALAKFEEADKYAPHWGRLHLKWGEALLWSGDKDGACKQFAMASHLDLAPSEKAALAKLIGNST